MSIEKEVKSGRIKKIESVKKGGKPDARRVI